MSASTRRRSVLADRTYRRLFGAQVVALLGTGLLTVALGLLAVDVDPERAGAVLATALSIKMVAYVAVAPVVAAAVAHLRPRTVLVGADLLRLLVALCLPWVDQAWHVYVLVLVLQSASATFTPAFQAVVPTVLTDEDEYTRGLSLSRLAYDLEAVVSPLVAAALLLVVSYHGLFVGTAVGFAASAGLVVRSHAGLRPTATAGSYLARTTLGLSRFAAVPSLRPLVALWLAVAAATATVLVNTVVVVRRDLGLGEVAVAVALAAYGVGSMAVAVSVPALLRRVEDRVVMLAGGALATVALLGAPAVLDRSFGGLLGVWTVLGAATSMMLTPVGRVVNRSVAAADRPAAFAGAFSLSHAWFLLCYPAAGWLGAGLGVPVSAAVLGGVACAATVGAVVLDRRAASTT